MILSDKIAAWVFAVISLMFIFVPPGLTISIPDWAESVIISNPSPVVISELPVAYMYS